jgi:hypothetical protein
MGRLTVSTTGLVFGVAPRANLYLVKVGYAIVDDKDEWKDDSMAPDAVLEGLRHVLEVIEKGYLGIQGHKSVINLSFGFRAYNSIPKYGAKRYQEYQEAFANYFEKLRQRGVTIVMATGNSGEQMGDDLTKCIPQALATTGSDLITVGATNNKGQLADFSTPGFGDNQVTLFAQGVEVMVPTVGGKVVKMKGTSYAAPAVVSLLAISERRAGYGTAQNETLTCTVACDIGRARRLFPVPARVRGPVRVRAGANRRGKAHEDVPPEQGVPALSQQRPARQPGRPLSGRPGPNSCSLQHGIWGPAR